MSSPNDQPKRFPIFAVLGGVVAFIILFSLMFVVLPEDDGLETWRYSRFIYAVEAGEIQAADITADRSRLTATTESGERVAVNLPNDPELLDTLAKNNVTVSIQQ